jgi:hypothetical protein
VSVRIGSLVFDHADYGEQREVRDLDVGEPHEAEDEETPEGHVLRFVPGGQRIVGLTIISARRVIERDGWLVVMVPESCWIAPAVAARQPSCPSTSGSPVA